MDAYGRRRLRSNEFRVFRLDLAVRTTLRGDLDVVTFDSDERYATLSYAWDHDNLDGSITLGGFTKRIPLSLERTIRHLRALRVRRLWIDQLCINQDNLPERNQQVARMRDIYRGGQECFVCLGEGTGYAGDVDSLLEWIKTSLDQNEMEAKGDIASKTLQQFRSLFVGTGSEPKSFQNVRPWHRCIDYIIAQRYWHRCWVVQELLVSRQITCLIGDEEFAWDHIRSLAFDVPFTRSTEANRAGRRKLKMVATAVSSEWRAYNRWTQSDLEAQSASNLRAFNRFMELLEHCKGQDLISLCRSVRMLRTSDPRDKIFAMLNIACDAGQYPKADYELSEDQVYRLYAECMIRNGHITSVLAASPALGVKKHRNWPTWAPRWDEAAPEFSWEASTLFSSCSSKVARARNNGQTMSVSAYFHDSIHSRSAAIHVANDMLYTELARFVDSVVSELRPPSPGHQRRTRNSHHPRSCLTENVAHLLLCDPTDHDCSVFLQESDAALSRLQKLQKSWDTINFLVHDQERDKVQGDSNAAVMQSIVPLLNPRYWTDGPFAAENATQSMLRKLINKNLKHRGMPYFNYLLGRDKPTLCVVTLRSQRAASCDRQAYKYVMGLAPAACRPGDRVAIIKGARAPFILRRRGPGEYENLGQAYIRGIMRGEVAETLDSDDFQDIDIV